LKKTDDKFSFINCTGRRSFLKNSFAGIAGIAGGLTGLSGCAAKISKVRTLDTPRNLNVASSESKVSLVADKNQREAAYKALKPLENDIIQDIGNRQVVIKINCGQVRKN